MRELPVLTLILVLILVSLACGGGTALPTTPEPVTDSSASPSPENSPTSPERTVTELPVTTAQAISFPGLMMPYIREGNLWFWSEAGGQHQMTDSGGLTDVSISGDGQMLAFIRGAEIWTARTDGMDVRLLVTRTVAGGTLNFSPNGLLLAVSDKDQIQLIDLTTSAISTVLTYPAIASGYEPEIVWAPDSAGFKTIIPATTETGQAEFFYVFTTGTAASLAKFSMVSPDDSMPFLSPDGGYVIYVANIADDKESLYLMDSSGATRPYGEPAKNIHTFGWQPDSKHFAYASETPQQTFIGNVSGQPVEISFEEYDVVRWVDAEYFLALESNRLYLSSIGGDKMQIDSGVSTFTFSQ